MKLAMKDFADAIEGILRARDVRTVTIFRGSQRVRVTRQRPEDGRDRTRTLVVSYGRPNWDEREHMAQCAKQKVKPRIWFRPWPEKKAKKTKSAKR